MQWTSIVVLFYVGFLLSENEIKRYSLQLLLEDP
jgi:hypothetical protein